MHILLIYMYLTASTNVFFFYLQFFTDYIVFTSEVIGQQLSAKLAFDQMLYKEREFAITIQFLK